MQVQPRTKLARSPHVRNTLLDLLYTLLTLGVYNIYVQYRQMLAVNEMIKSPPGNPKYRFSRWAILSIFTFGLYHFYHEFRKSLDIHHALHPGAERPVFEPLLHLAIAVIGVPFVTDALQQVQINRFFGDEGSNVQ